MTRSKRRLLIDTGLLAITLTLIVVLLELGGLLDLPEHMAYDLRARFFQKFTPPPTDKLVHVDIDDASLQNIGHWPWPRQKLAEIVDEIRLAGAEALATDIIFPEPAPYDVDEEMVRTIRRSADLSNTLTTRPTTGPTTLPDSSVHVDMDLLDNDQA